MFGPFARQALRRSSRSVAGKAAHTQAQSLDLASVEPWRFAARATAARHDRQPSTRMTMLNVTGRRRHGGRSSTTSRCGSRRRQPRATAGRFRGTCSVTGSSPPRSAPEERCLVVPSRAPESGADHGRGREERRECRCCRLTHSTPGLPAGLASAPAAGSRRWSPDPARSPRSGRRCGSGRSRRSPPGRGRGHQAWS